LRQLVSLVRILKEQHCLHVLLIIDYTINKSWHNARYICVFNGVLLAEILIPTERDPDKFGGSGGIQVLEKPQDLNKIWWIRTLDWKNPGITKETEDQQNTDRRAAESPAARLTDQTGEYFRTTSQN